MQSKSIRATLRVRIRNQQMTVTLYLPDQAPKVVSEAGFRLDEGSGQVIQNSARAAEVLGCDPGMIDVLACGAGYLVYTIFDHEGETNFPAMGVVAEITSIEFDVLDGDAVLRGPVLVAIQS